MIIKFLGFPSAAIFFSKNHVDWKNSKNWWSISVASGDFSQQQHDEIAT